MLGIRFEILPLAASVFGTRVCHSGTLEIMVWVKFRHVSGGPATPCRNLGARNMEPTTRDLSMLQAPKPEKAILAETLFSCFKLHALEELASLSTSLTASVISNQALPHLPVGSPVRKRQAASRLKSESGSRVFCPAISRRDLRSLRTSPALPGKQRWHL